MKTNKVLLFIFLLTSPFALAESEFEWEEVGGEPEYHQTQTPKHVDKTPIKKQDQLDTINKQSNSKSVSDDWQEVEDTNKQKEPTRQIKTNDKNIPVEKEMQFDEIQSASQPEKATARNKPKSKNKITLLPDNYLDNIASSNEDASHYNNVNINQYENKLVEIPQESNIVTTTNETKYANVDLTYVYIYLACFLIALIASYVKYRNRKTITTNTQKSI